MQVPSRTVFQEVSVGSGAQGPADGVLFAADGEDDELGGAASGSQLAHYFSSIHTRHMQVEDGEIGLQRLDHFERSLAIRALPQDPHALCGAEGGESLANDGMIVRQYDSRRAQLVHLSLQARVA
jgi:hypothetical protein